MWLVPVQPVLVQPVQLEPGPGPAAQPLSRAKRARFISEAQSGPPALCWQPYVGHMALRLGRSGLWCMRCFTQPIGDYRVWLRGRCSDERPPSVAPSSLSAALLRAGDLDAHASEALRRRFAVLLASARVVPVPVAAFREGDQAGGRPGTGARSRLVRGGGLMWGCLRPSRRRTCTAPPGPVQTTGWCCTGVCLRLFLEVGRGAAYLPV